MAKYATFEKYYNTTAPSLKLNWPDYDLLDIIYPEELLNPQPIVLPIALPEIQQLQEIISEVLEPTKKRKFRRKLETTKLYDHTISFLLLCKNIGVEVRVTSELRPGAKTKSGKSSNHSIKDAWGRSKAIDIVPVDGDFEKLKNKLLNSPEARNWFLKRGYGILNEIIPQVMSQTKATGKHFHIGPDLWAQRIWNQWLLNPNMKATQFIG